MRRIINHNFVEQLRTNSIPHYGEYGVHGE